MFHPFLKKFIWSFNQKMIQQSFKHRFSIDSVLRFSEIALKNPAGYCSGYRLLLFPIVIADIYLENPTRLFLRSRNLKFSQEIPGKSSYSLSILWKSSGESPEFFFILLVLLVNFLVGILNKSCNSQRMLFTNFQLDLCRNPRKNHQFRINN